MISATTRGMLWMIAGQLALVGALTFGTSGCYYRTQAAKKKASSCPARRPVKSRAR